jgi:photosystem II stability/assembly factor-like uncharacterized protein
MKLGSITRLALHLVAAAAFIPAPTLAGIGPTDDAEVYAIALDPTDPNIIYAGTDDGIYKAEDGGQNWSLANEGITGIIYSNMVVNRSNPSIVIMGTDGDGVYQTSNGAQSWNLGTGSYNPVTKSLSFDPVYPNVVNMGTFRDIYRSFDYGRTWSLLHQFSFVTGVLSIANDPVATTRMYIGTNTQGVLKSSDWGINWATTAVTQSTGVVALDPFNHNTVFAGSLNSIFKSDDAGASWREVLALDGAYTTALAFDTANPGTIYASFFYQSVYVTNDGGESWSPSGEGLPTFNINDLAVDSQNGIVYAATGTSGIFVSYDGGQTWQ